MQTADGAGRSKRRPRLSLMNLLLLTAFVGASISTWMLWREVGPLRAEVRRYRDEFGVLTIEDPAKLHAIRLRTAEVEGYEWAWRVYVPEGKTATVSTRTESPSSTVEARSVGSGRLTISSGEHVVRMRLAPGASDRYVLRTSAGGSASTHGTRLPTDSGGMSSRFSSDVQHTTSVHEEGATVLLLEAQFEPDDWPGVVGKPVMKLQAILEVP